jgi:hypothetical protein
MDNTAVNTGFDGSLSAFLEKKLGRKLHLIGCFLHINELPLRLVNNHGLTKSANKLSYSSTIGQQLDEAELLRLELVNTSGIWQA